MYMYAAVSNLLYDSRLSFSCVCESWHHVANTGTEIHVVCRKRVNIYGSWSISSTVSGCPWSIHGPSNIKVTKSLGQNIQGWHRVLPRRI